MTTPADIDSATLAASRLFLERISRSYDYAGAFLFGSRARKTHRTDSDADVAVLLRGMPAQFVGTKLAMDDIAYDVLLETGIRVQPPGVRHFTPIFAPFRKVPSALARVSRS